MPNAGELDNRGFLLRQLLYGKSKARKTTWALKYAELGFNVILLDGDGEGRTVLPQFSLEARKRIFHVDLFQRVDGTPVFSNFVAMFLKPGNYFTWDEDNKCEIPGLRPPGRHYAKFNAGKLTSNDVLILDSYSALVISTMFNYAKENKIELDDAEKTDWQAYGYQGRWLDWVFTRLKALPCHVIMIGHATIYEKWDRRSSNPKEHKIIEQRMQLVSSSGPHAKTIPQHFSDVLFFEQTGFETWHIQTGGDRDRDGGCRAIAPMKKNWDDLPPKFFADAVGAKANGAPLLAVEVLGPSESIAGTGTSAEIIASARANPPVLEAAKAAAAKPGISSLFAKAKGGQS